VSTKTGTIQGDYGYVFLKRLFQPVIVYREIKTQAIADLRRESIDIVIIYGFSILDICKF